MTLWTAQRQLDGDGRRDRDTTSTAVTAMEGVTEMEGTTAMEGATAMEDATAMDGAMVTAMAAVAMDDHNDNGWCDGDLSDDSSLTVMDGKGRRERNGDGDGRCNADSTVMDSRARRRWTEQGQLNGDGQRIGNTRTMDNEEGMSTTSMLTRPTMEATKASAPSRH
jgi:hypothetical protein